MGMSRLDRLERDFPNDGREGISSRDAAEGRVAFYLVRARKRRNGINLTNLPIITGDFILRIILLDHPVA